MSNKAVEAEARRRYADFAMNRPKAARTRAPRTKLPAKSARRAVPQKPNRPLTVGKAKRVAMFTPNVTDSMPACSDDGATSAGAVYAHTRKTVTIGPGQTWVLLVCPESGCLGYACLTDANESQDVPFVNGMTLVGPPITGQPADVQLWCDNGFIGNINKFSLVPNNAADTGPFYTFKAVHYTNDAFQIPGSNCGPNDPSNNLWQVLEGEYTPQAGDVAASTTASWLFNDPFQGNQALLNCETGTVEIEVACDWNAGAEVYHVGTNSSNQILGPRTTRTAQNDGNPTDSVTFCQNPVVVGFSQQQVVQGNAPYGSMTQGLSTLLAPDFLTGTQRKTYTIDVLANSHDTWQHLGSSKFPTEQQLAYPNCAGFTLNDGVTPLNQLQAWGMGAPSMFPGFNCHPPFVYSGSTIRNYVDEGNPNNSGSGSIEDANNMLCSTFFTSPQTLGKMVCGLYHIRNTGSEGSVRISLQGKQRYNVQWPPQSLLVQANQPCLPFSPPVDPTLIGHAGSGPTQAHARIEVAAATMASAQQRGIPLDPEVKSAMVKSAKKPLEKGSASGASPTSSIANISDGVEAASSLAKATVVPALGLISSDLAAGATDVINVVDSVANTVGKVADALGPFAELFDFF